MAREDLNVWPATHLPVGFRIRPYQAGDAAHWRTIHERSDPFNSFEDNTFGFWFGTDEAVLQARQKYLIAPDGEVIGTATAWFDTQEIGRVHWVAIVPEYQGRGLSKPLIAATLQTLRDLGHTRAVLGTSTQRPAAIALYRKFGFVEI